MTSSWTPPMLRSMYPGEAERAGGPVAGNLSPVFPIRN